MMTVCAECGKRMLVHWPEFWPYRRRDMYFCTDVCKAWNEHKEFKERTGWMDDYYRLRKGGKPMAGKVTLEQKKKAVEIAIGGGNPLPYLKKCGSDAPDKLWYVIKQNLKKVDPVKFAQIPERVNSANKTVSMAPVPEPVVDLTIDSEELTRMEIEQEKLQAEARRTVEEIMNRSDVTDADKMRIDKPVNYDGFDVTAVKSPDSGFRFENDPRYGMMTWNTMSGDEVSLTAEEWRKLAGELPRVLQIFGI